MNKYIAPFLLVTLLGFSTNALAIDAGGAIGSLLGGSDAASKGTGKKTYVRTQEGKGRKYISSKYQSEEDMYAKGACQMVKTDNNPVFKIKPIKNADFLKGEDLYEVKGKASSFPLAGPLGGVSSSSDGFNARKEEITDLSGPYAPRHNPDWQERQSGSLSYASAARDTKSQVINGVFYSYTHVCGRKKVFPPLKPRSIKKAWEDGFDYYKRVQENSAGSIFVDTARDQAFTNAFPACWIPIYTACQASSSWWVDCKVLATRSCEDLLCRKIILPPVTPNNNLKFAYNNAPEGPGSAKKPASSSGGSSSGVPIPVPSFSTGARGMKNNSNLPYIYSQNREGVEESGIKTTALSYFYSEPQKSFGYNGPPIAFPQTGLPASMAVLKSIGCDPTKMGLKNPRPGGSTCKNLDKLEYWRTTVVGVNEGYDAEGTNDTSKEAFNNSGQVGGWEHLIRYQGDCISKFGLNCVCNRALFTEGSASGHVLARTGSGIVIGNEIKKRERVIPINDGSADVGTTRNPTNVIVENQSAMELLSRNMPTVLNGTKLSPVLGKRDDKGETFPYTSKDGSEKKTGLSHADKGDIITYATSKTNSGVKKRPFMTYIVLEKRDDGCLLVETQDNGAFRNSAGFSEAHGSVSNRIMCGSNSAVGSTAPPAGAGGGAVGAIMGFFGGTFDIKGGFSMEGGAKGKYPSCVNVYAYQCMEPDWDLYTVEKRK